MKARIAQIIRQSYQAWCRFFFEADATAQLRLLRILLSILLFVAYAIRAIDNEYYYGATGVLDLEKMLEWFPMQYRYSFLISFPGSTALKICTGVFLGSLVTLGFGIFPRFSACIAFVMHVSFMHRNMAIVYGLDMISAFFLFYLIFAKTDSKPKSKNSWAQMLSSMALRFTQIQVCVIYVYSGWEKLKGPAWWRGEAIWSVFANTQIARWNMDWVAHFPLVISAATYATLLFEIYFPALIWLKRWRPALLVLGVVLHFGIGLVVFIPFFSALMVLSYVSFLTPKEAEWALQRVNPLKFGARKRISK